MGTFRLAFANSATTQVSLDLIVALSLIVVWMWRDAREHKVSPLAFVVITVVAGSLGPLLYLFRRSGLQDPASPSRSVPANQRLERPGA